MFSSLSAAASIRLSPSRLCLQALGKDRVSGFYVDTGLMREGETAYVRDLFRRLGSDSFMVEEAGDQFLGALAGVVDPEEKRHIIGEQFVAVQERILRTGHFLDGAWILGQGTIYPDTIESGGTAKADLIKTHHNRVAGIQKLIDEGRIVEPLDVLLQRRSARNRPRAWACRTSFWTGIPSPARAWRSAACARMKVEVPCPMEGGWLVPIKSVGVQGDIAELPRRPGDQGRAGRRH